MVIQDQAQILYRNITSYKYQLMADHTFNCEIIGYDITTPFINLQGSGLVKVKAGYCWDGASGPAVDTITFMLPSLEHDVLCQLMADGLLIPAFSKHNDKLLYANCLACGMNPVRAWAVYHFVRLYDRMVRKRMKRKSPDPDELLTAP